MASITKDSFDETKENVKVLYQKGRDLPDFELNENADIQRVHRARMADALQAEAVDLFNRGAAQITGSGAANDVDVAAGRLHINGININIAAETLSAKGVTLTTAVGANRYDYVYISVSEVEIDAATDPDMAISALGETARRRRLSVTWAVSEGVAPPASGSGPLRTATKIIPVARLFRADGVAAIGADDVLDLRPAMLTAQNFLMGAPLLRLTTNGVATWDLNTTIFSIGDPDNPLDLTQGLEVGFGGGPVSVLNGGAPMASSGDMFVWRRAKLNTDQSLRVPGVTPIASATDGLDDTAGLVVATIGTLQEGDLILATRVGNDILLRNGGLIHGQGNVEARTGIWTQDANVGLRQWHVTIGDGSSSFGDLNGVNQLLFVLNNIPAAESVVIDLLEGIWSIPAATAPTVNFASIITLATQHIQIRGRSTRTESVSVIISDRNSANLSGPAILFSGNGHVTIEGVHFQEGDIEAAATTVRFEDLDTLILHDCAFQGWVTSNNLGDVRVTHCSFVGNQSEGLGVKMCAFWGTNAGTTNLNLGSKIVVEHCHFQSGSSGQSDHLHITGALMHAVVRNCYFTTEGGGVDSSAPSGITIDGEGGVVRWVDVEDNHFVSPTGSTSERGFCIEISVGERINCNRNVMHPGGTGHGWAALIRIQNTQQTTFVRGTQEIEAIHCNDNVAENFRFAGIGGTFGHLISIFCNSSDVSSVSDVQCKGNSIFFTNLVDLNGSAVGMTIAGSTSPWRGLVCSFNTVRCDAANGTPADDVFVGIRVDPTGATVNGVRVVGNEVTIDPGIGTTTPGGSVDGIDCSSATFKRAVFKANTISMFAGTTGDRSVAIGLGASTVSVVVGDNYLEAEYPVDAAGTDTYVTGNITKDCSNPLLSLSAGINTTFLAADNKNT